MTVKTPTQKQIKLIKLIVENLGNQKTTKSIGKLMLEAGYSKIQSENPHQIFYSEAVQDGISDFVKMLDDKRRMALTKITESKLDKSTARELASITDTLNKTHELLSGKPTENVNYKISKGEKDKIDNLLDDE